MVCDFTLEKKIYDRQVSKQGMSGKTFLHVNKTTVYQVTMWMKFNHLLVICLFEDRVVDDLNPVLNFTRKEVESLLHFVEEEPEAEKISGESQEDFEEVLYKACQLYPNLITKVCYHIQQLHLLK